MYKIEGLSTKVIKDNNKEIIEFFPEKKKDDIGLRIRINKIKENLNIVECVNLNGKRLNIEDFEFLNVATDDVDILERIVRVFAFKNLKIYEAENYYTKVDQEFIEQGFIITSNNFGLSWSKKINDDFICSILYFDKDKSLLPTSFDEPNTVMLTSNNDSYKKVILNSFNLKTSLMVINNGLILSKYNPYNNIIMTILPTDRTIN